MTKQTRTVWFDIDGTIADATHRLHYIQNRPKNWKMFFQTMIDDAVHYDIVDLLKMFNRQGDTIVLCSGRPDEWRELTREWLARHDIPFHALYMRKKGDYRDDSIVKVELLHKMRDDGLSPFLAFDDRTRVVKALRAAGVKVLQVAEGDF